MSRYGMYWVVQFAFLSRVFAAESHHGNTSPVALTVSGGGFRAQWSAGGFLAGMLAYMGQEHHASSPTFVSTGLLNRFNMLSSNSGGTWFMTSLVYSETYVKLLESMAASPGSSSLKIQSQWITPFLEATGVQPTHFNLLREIAEKILSKILKEGDEDTLFLLIHFLATGFTWNHFTDTLLKSTASLTSNTKLGSNPNQWASGKEYYPAHSVLVPNASAPARLYQGSNLHGLPKLNYYAETCRALPTLVPAKFSIKLGAGTSSSATQTYMPSAIASCIKQFVYKAVVAPGSDEPSAKSGTLDVHDVCGGALTRSAGMLPVTGPSAASSAFEGVAPVLGSLVVAAGALTNANVLPFVSSAQDGASFATATQIFQNFHTGVGKSTVDSLAKLSFHGIADGGYTDNTAIGHAVAAGAREILAVLNNGAGGTAPSLDLLFKGHPDPSYGPGYTNAVFPVFDSPVYSEWETEFKAFHTLVLPATKYLKKFAVGTITATTASNEFFGIEGGHTITVHVVSLSSVLSIGYLEAIKNYGALAQEIVQAIVSKDNAAFVGSTLLPMFLGAVREEKLTVI